MIRIVINRLLWILPILFLANLFGFAYASFARTRAGVSSFFVSSNSQSSILSDYSAYLASLFDSALWSGLAQAAINSLGLLLLALLVAVALGFLLGMWAVRLNPPRIAGWLTPIATLGLAAPSYVIGTFGIVAIFAWLIWGPNRPPPLPFKGFRWDSHLVLPVLALAARPISQIAQMIASLMVDELRQPYIMAARGKGLADRQLRWRHAFANVRAPLIQTVASSLRLMIGEQILIEALFSWPGLGNVLANTLTPSGIIGATQVVEAGFLRPSLVATLATLLAALFVFVDSAAALLVTAADPRQ